MAPLPSCTITSQAIAAMFADAERERPRECCGILLGQGDDITEAVAVRNVAASADCFLLDPAEHIRVRRDARHRGLDVVGFYHSHPHSPPAPSQTDVAELAYPDCLYAIVSLTGEAPAVQVFAWQRGRFVNVKMTERT